MKKIVIILIFLLSINQAWAQIDSLVKSIFYTIDPLMPRKDICLKLKSDSIFIPSSKLLDTLETDFVGKVLGNGMLTHKSDSTVITLGRGWAPNNLGVKVAKNQRSVILKLEYFYRSEKTIVQVFDSLVTVIKPTTKLIQEIGIGDSYGQEGIGKELLYKDQSVPFVLRIYKRYLINRKFSILIEFERIAD